MKTVDARGHSCPIPVVMVRKAVTSEKPEALEVLVDNQGYSVDVAAEGADFRLKLSK